MLLIVFFIHQVSLGATVRLGSGTIRTTQIVRPVTFSISKMRCVKNSPPVKKEKKKNHDNNNKNNKNNNKLWIVGSSGCKE